MFQKATRSQAKLKAAITGPSGGGKTMSALRLAKGLVGPKGKIAVVDSENKSASLYSDRFDFDTLHISPPYETKKYLEGIMAAIEGGYDVVILDSITHAWAGEGGILDRKTALDARGGNSFTNWAKFTPEQNKFLEKIVQSDIHMIVTMRSKQDYVIETNAGGKSAPRKVGLAPVQREGTEYEFTVVFDADMSHQVQTSKDRTGLFDGKTFQITEETGQQLKAWLDSGAPATGQVVPSAPITQPIKLEDELLAMVNRLTDEDLKGKVVASIEKYKENPKKLQEIKTNLTERLK